MKTLLNIVLLAVMVCTASCGSGVSEKKLESKGYFGKLVSIKQAYHDEDSAFTAKAKTEAKSVDDLVAVQSKLAKMKEDAKAEFTAEASKLGLPITLPFIDSTGNASYVIKDAKIIAAEWDRATVQVTVEVKQDSEKTMGGQNVQISVPMLMLDENNKVIKDHAYDNWIVLAVSKAVKAGEINQVTGFISINQANSALKKVLFKSFEAYKKAKGWN